MNLENPFLLIFYTFTLKGSTFMTHIRDTLLSSMSVNILKEDTRYYLTEYLLQKVNKAANDSWNVC